MRVPGGQACAHVFFPSLKYILVCVLCVCGSVFSSPLHLPLEGVEEEVEEELRGRALLLLAEGGVPSSLASES